jgi:hypothetical protein
MTGARTLLFSLAVVSAVPVSGQSISPKFSWPATASAELMSTGDSRSSMAGRLDSARYRTRSKIEVRPDARGLLSRQVRRKHEGSVGGANGPSMAGMLSMVTRYLVSREAIPRTDRYGRHEAATRFCRAAIHGADGESPASDA